MGDEVVALDVERARQLASACNEVGSAADRLAGEIESLLAGARQSPAAGRLLAEVAEELALLAGVIAGSTDQVEGADRWTVGDLFDAAGDRLLSGFSEQWLWRSLNDPVGALALDVGVFELADSFRRMDPVEWRLAMTAPGCRSFGDGRYYSGGGALRGPDGRLYPVVVAHLVTQDSHFTIDADVADSTPSVASLGGGDPGWTMIGYRTGVERITAEPNRWWRMLTGLAVATGLDLSPGVDDDYLSGVHLRAGWRPQFSATIPAPAPTEPIGSGPLAGLQPMVWLVIDGHARQHSIAEAPDLVPDREQLEIVPHPFDTPLGRANTADNLLALATGAMTGYVAGRDLDHGSHRAYEVIFEENVDGRRRSRIQSFTLEQGTLEEGRAGVALYGWHLLLDSEGDLRQSPVSYQSPNTVTSDDVVLADNPLDPGFAQRVGRPALSATAD